MSFSDAKYKAQATKLQKITWTPKGRAKLQLTLFRLNSILLLIQIAILRLIVGIDWMKTVYIKIQWPSKGLFYIPQKG